MLDGLVAVFSNERTYGPDGARFEHGVKQDAPLRGGRFRRPSKGDDAGDASRSNTDVKEVEVLMEQDAA